MIVDFAQHKIAAAGRKIAFLAAVFASALTGAAFLIAGAWAALADFLGSATASAAVGLILLTPAIAIRLGPVFRRSRKPRPGADAPVSIGQMLVVFTLAVRLGEILGRFRSRAARPNAPVPDRTSNASTPTRCRRAGGPENDDTPYQDLQRETDKE